MFLLASWQVTGGGNVPTQGTLLVVANHLSLADPPILGVSISRKVIFMAKEELFRSRFSRFFVANFGAFPVRRGGLDRNAFKLSEYWLAKGMALVMFPEGQRSQNARLQPAFAGSALIALRLGVPILPIGITGTENIKGATWWLYHRPKITVNFGRPFNLPPTNGKLTRSELAQQTNCIMEHIAELLPPEYRGNYRGRKNKKI